MSNQFQVFSGIRQGPILSAFLLNLTFDHAMETALDGETFGVTLDDMLFTDLHYADDICVSEVCPVEAQKILELVTTETSEKGLSIKVPKTKFCSRDRMIQLQCGGEPLKAVQEFTYLEDKIQLGGFITSELKASITKEAGSFKILSDFRNQRSVPTGLKLKVYNECVRVVF